MEGQPVNRDPALQLFTDAVLAAFADAAPCPEARASLDRIAAALATPASRRARPGGRLPVCAHREAALAVASEDESLAP
jgi:hypothetical protein